MKKPFPVAILSVLLSLVAAQAEGATVKQVLIKKKLVVIDLEDDETFEKGATLCFFTEAGKKVDCGSLAKVKGKVGIVKLESAKKMKRLKAGMDVKVGEAADAEVAEDSDGEPSEKKSKNAKEPKASKSPFRVWIQYNAGLATPAVYNKLSFDAPTTETPDSLWKGDKKASSSLLGFDLQVGIPVGAFSLNPGLRYRKFTPAIVDADYIVQKENPYVSTEEQASALGLFVDFQVFRMPFSGNSGLNLTSGIDADMSTVTLKSTKKDDSGATPSSSLAKATSKLTVLSLRLGAGMDFFFTKVFGMSLGTNVLLPLSEAGKKFSGSLADGEAHGEAEPGKDLQTQLGHKKNTVAYEITLGTVLGF